MTTTLVRPYNVAWPDWFERLRARIESLLNEVRHTVEHVGSTAIPGMTAKPVIDIDIVIEPTDFQRTRALLGQLGYAHQGDKGISDREAFDLVDVGAKQLLPSHHLYVCMRDAPELHKHLLFRDFLRKHPEWVQRLSEHKVALCERHGNDRQAYMDAKADMVQQITELAKAESRTSA